MLVLSRHRDESIIIGDDIVITVVDIRGDKVRLGIAAPIEISVHRQEVYEAQTSPLLALYADRGLLVRVDGLGAVDEVQARILDALPQD